MPCKVRARRIGPTLYLRIPSSPAEMVNLDDGSEGRFGIKRPADDIFVLTYTFRVQPRDARLTAKPKKPAEKQLVVAR